MFFSKLVFLKNSIRNIIRVANSLDQNQAQHFVGPDLGPNCLQSYQQMTKVTSSMQRVTVPSKSVGAKTHKYQYQADYKLPICLCVSMLVYFLQDSSISLNRN